MKKIFLMTAICIAASCTGKQEKAEQCARQFLDCYLSNDFEGAAQCCSESFKPDFMQAMETYSNMEPELKELLQKECMNYKAQITSVTRINESDTFDVNYRIIKISPNNSESFERGEIISTLKVLNGKVLKLNR